MYKLYCLLLFGLLFGGYTTDLWAQSDTTETTEASAVTAADKPYRTVSTMPKFIGGHDALRQYLSKNLTYPQSAMEQNIQGDVMVEFVIRKDGVIADVHALSSPDPILAAEAERVIRNMPPWIPGEQDGKAVSVYYTVPIAFYMNGGGGASNTLFQERKAIPDTDTAYRMVSKMPSFPGGGSALKKYLSEHLNYPQRARELNLQGTVLVEFVVRKNGQVNQVRTLSAPDSVLAAEAERVVRNMPRWIPGEIDGKAVSTYYKMPVAFRLQDAAEQTGIAQDSAAIWSKQPSFPGGIAALAEYLEDAVHYPLVAIDEDIQGTVMVAFTVNADGSISDVAALNQLNGGCTEEAVRVVEAMPHWIPAENIQGEKVAAQYRIPIIFQLKYASGGIEVTPKAMLSKFPEFPGGTEAYEAFSKKYITYPNFAAKAGIQGLVFLSCVIDSTGAITVVQTLRSPDPILTKEAIRVVKLMPKWIPAEDLQGKKVAAMAKLPVTFRLTR